MIKINSDFNGIDIPGSKAAMDVDLGKDISIFRSGNHNDYIRRCPSRIEKH